MGDTGFSSFNTTVQKTNEILKEIEQVTEGEWEIIRANMPKAIASLLQTGAEASAQPTT